MGNVTIEGIENLLEYRPEVGGSCLVWKEDRGSQKVKGSRAGYRGRRYWRVKVKGKMLLAHRIVWTLVNGSWPTCDLDHIDGDVNNNCIENLRPCRNGQLDNLQNTDRYKNNTSGYAGVDWHKASRKWRARIKVGGVSYELGLFNTTEEAHAAYLEAKKKHHEFQPVPRQERRDA